MRFILLFIIIICMSAVVCAFGYTTNAFLAGYDTDMVLSPEPTRYLIVVADISQQKLLEYYPFSPDIVTFGSYASEGEGTLRNYVRLDYAYSGVDILNRIRWGTGFHRILVKNVGGVANAKIVMDVIE